MDRPAITGNRSQSQQRELEARDMVTWHTITRHNRLGVWGMWNVRGESGGGGRGGGEYVGRFGNEKGLVRR